jgi:biofilm PGA synthesis N-glycosyltransferase PgaC
LVIWYPVVYWAYNSLATIVAAPKGIFHRMNRAAVWVSPDRGIRK